MPGPSNSERFEITAQCASATNGLQTSPIVEEVSDARRDATDIEVRALRHVVDDIPLGVWIVALAYAAERFTYYAVTAPWQNYMQNSTDSKTIRGALGLGQSTATNIYNAFFFVSYLTPLPFAILSDTRLGKYKTLCISLMFYIAGCLIVFATSLPVSLEHGAGLGGLATAMILIALGVGGIKATFPPLLADQYDSLKPQLVVRGNERVVADRTLTIQYIYNVSYWLTNIAGLSGIAATFLEKIYGFWAAYLLPTCSLWVAVILLVVWRKSLIQHPPQGNALPLTGRVLAIATKHKFKLSAAEPSISSKSFPWDSSFISEIRRGLIACRIIFSFVAFYLCYNQISNNLVSQAGQMELSGVPNDTIQALNSVACILLGPIFQNFLYPFFARRHIRFGPIRRITLAFATMAAAMAYAAGIQRLIYNTGPCYSNCPSGTSHYLSVWLQTPVYFILAGAEILGFVTASEYAYSKAPRDMKSLVQALTQVTAGVGSALGMAISPVAIDPFLVIMYASLAAVMAVFALLFWLMCRKLDNIDEELNDLDGKAEKGVNERAEDDKKSTA